MCHVEQVLGAALESGLDMPSQVRAKGSLDPIATSFLADVQHEAVLFGVVAIHFPVESDRIGIGRDHLQYQGALLLCTQRANRNLTGEPRLLWFGSKAPLFPTSSLRGPAPAELKA